MESDSIIVGKLVTVNKQDYKAIKEKYGVFKNWVERKAREKYGEIPNPPKLVWEEKKGDKHKLFLKLKRGYVRMIKQDYGSLTDFIKACVNEENGFNKGS